MDPMVTLMVLLSAGMHALRNFFNKRALDKQAFAWWFELLGLILFTPVFLVVLYREGVNLSISWPFVVLSGIVHFIYWFFLTMALDKGDLSLVYPIARSSPALVLIVSVTILKESVSPLGILGISLVAAGVYTIHMSRLDLPELVKPLRSLIRDRAVQYAFLTLAAVASYSLVDKMAVSRMHPVAFAWLYPWISLGLFSTYLHRAKATGVVKREWQVHKRSILTCSFLGIFGYFLILLAFTVERVSYIVGLRQVSIVFAVLLGGHFLNEKNRMIRIVSSMIIFLGCYCITIAD